MNVRKTGFTVGLIVLAVSWILLVIAFHKWDATWFGISFWIIGIPVSMLLVLGFEFVYQYFFQGDTTTGVCAIVLVLFVFSVLAGIIFTEPVGRQPFDTSAREYDYSTSRVGGFYYLYYPMYFGGGSGSSSGAVVSTSSSSDNKAMGYLAMLVAVVVVILASAIFPHFWVIAALTAIFCWLRISWHEITILRKRGSWKTF